MIAEVVINRTAKKLNRTFDYAIPKELEDFVIIGSKVLVPFGKGGKLEEAFVTRIKDNTEFKVKEIAKIENSLDEKQIELAKWMANRYFCNISDCIKLMLTPGTRGKEKKAQEKIIRVVYLKKKKDEILFEIDNKKIKSEKQIRVLKFIQKNEGLTIPEIEMHTDCSRAIINTLIKNGYLELVEEKIERDPLRNKNLASTNKLKLTEEQQNAFEKVAKSIDEKEYKRFLLYGVTGSRKNRSIFTVNTKNTRNAKNCNCFSS